MTELEEQLLAMVREKDAVIARMAEALAAPGRIAVPSTAPGPVAACAENAQAAAPAADPGLPEMFFQELALQFIEYKKPTVRPSTASALAGTMPGAVRGSINAARALIGARHGIRSRRVGDGPQGGAE